jgi:hypothetical protein
MRILFRKSYFDKYDQQIEDERKIYGMVITNGGCNCEKKGSYTDPI